MFSTQGSNVVTRRMGIAMTNRTTEAAKLRATKLRLNA